VYYRSTALPQENTQKSPRPAGRAGRPISEADARIAAIVRSRGAALATRNVQDFAGGELQVIDPCL
jgi:predicted nucleic acid-binding protein